MNHTDIQAHYDYVIVGSGFGGSVSALRLAEKGYSVLVIEMGKWHSAEDFPATNWNLKRWLWFPPFRWYGIMKITCFRHLNILSGTGVGGGSLVYANTLPVPKSEFFNSGSWQNLADWQTELAPYYDIASKMLGATKNPELYDGDLALQQLSTEIGAKEQFHPTNVAVYFGKPNITVNDPYFDGKGPQRTGCNFCGGCMTGCRFNAKNTLDKNYLYLAQQLGVKILAEHRVFDITPLGRPDGAEGYTVRFKPSTSLSGKSRSVTSRGIVFAGGVLGTMNLLLRLKRSSLPNLSDKLGHDIRTNNETLMCVTNLDGKKNFSRGIAIGSILHTDKDSHLEVVRYAEGSGFWRMSYWPVSTGKNAFSRIAKILGKVLVQPIAHLKLFLVRDWAKSTAVLLFMQTRDSTLRFTLRKRRMASTLSAGEKPTAFIPRSADLARKYAKIVNGKETVTAIELLAEIPTTAHILGGAVVGKDATEGVINKNNKIFGYEHMFICDGSMISANPGVNPALSITAISERAMALIPRCEGKSFSTVHAPQPEQKVDPQPG
jgi:cholesterol oxidase